MAAIDSPGAMDDGRVFICSAAVSIERFKSEMSGSGSKERLESQS